MRIGRISARADSLHAGVGTEASAVVYFEVVPGEFLATHRDSAEEILLVLDGTGSAWVGDEEIPVEPGSLAAVERQAAGRVKQTRAPPPSRSSAQILPPWASTRPRAIASPRPAPRVEREGSPRQKRSNIRS